MSKTLIKLNNYQIPAYIKRRFWLEKAPNLKKSEIDSIFNSLKEFLYLSYKYKNVYLSSYIVDEAWHVFILFTKDYQKFCNEVFGEFIHHTPSISKNGYKDDIKEIKNTYFLVKENNPTSKIFDHDSELDIHGSKYKGIIEIKEENENISIFLNKKRIG